MTRFALLSFVFARFCFSQYRVQADNRILTVPVEEYVAHVVTGESGDFRSPEALKAMAVAARTYAARMIGRHQKEGFDFCSTTHCQRFVTPASARALAAALATAGELVWFNGKPAMTLYSQSCGGRSEGMADFPYLTVHTDPFCQSNWERIVSSADIVRALKASALNTPDPLQSIGIVSRTTSGRASTLSLSGKNGATLIAATSFRFALGRALGWNTLRSELFEVYPGFVFRGSGEGHGIGLCQRGADAMGAQGKTYREILAFYYPHTVPFQWTRMASEHVVVFMASDGSDRQVIAAAERAYRTIAVPWNRPANVEIWVYPTVEAFRNATAEPGWVAARTAGVKIEMQPASVLEQRGILDSTLRHEICHALIESAAKPGLPVWFREGLAEWLSGERPNQPSGGESNDIGIRQRQNQHAASAAYASARARVAELVRTNGQAAVLSWVTHGLPSKVSAP